MNDRRADADVTRRTPGSTRGWIVPAAFIWVMREIATSASGASENVGMFPS
jgi:hypothetical protein